MKKEDKAKVEESAWDRSYRDQTPSDAELSNYDPSYFATANIDISNRIDNTDFTRTPFTITQGMAKAKSKAKASDPLPQSVKPPIDKKNGEKERKLKWKKPIDIDNIEATEDRIENSSEDTKVEDTEGLMKKKKKKQKKIMFGGYSSYAEWDEAEERAARAGGRPIFPAAVELPPTKKEERRRDKNWSKPVSGWLDSTGRSKPTTKSHGKSSLPLSRFTPTSAHVAAVNQNKKRKAAAPAEPSLIDRLDAVDKDNAKKPKTTKATEKAVREKKEPAKKGKAAAKGTKPKGKSKKDADEVDSDVKFSRLPAGATPNDDFPILKGFERMKSLPTKKRPAQVDIDKLIPLTKSKLTDQTKQNKTATSKKNKAFKSAEMIELDDEDNESIDPPSDTEATIHASSATLNGSGKMTKWFSQALKSIPQEVKPIPSLDRTNTTHPTDTFLTPKAESQHDDHNPSTMTHLSTRPRVSEYATSSSQLPYSSPVVGKYGRSTHAGIMTPVPIRGRSSHIANLQRMAYQGQSRPKGYNHNPTAAQEIYNRDQSPDGFIGTSFPEEQDVKEEEEEWSTIRPRQGRHANNSIHYEEEYSQPSAKHSTALFPHQPPIQQSRPAPASASRYNKITVFQPPSRPAQPSTGYAIARIPNGARNAVQRQEQHHVEEMQWKGTPRRNLELQNPKTNLSYLQTAEAARPNPTGNWKDEWMTGQKPRRDISNNKLGKYAMKEVIKKGDVDGQGRAFRL